MYFIYLIRLEHALRANIKKLNDESFSLLRFSSIVDCGVSEKQAC